MYNKRPLILCLAALMYDLSRALQNLHCLIFLLNISMNTFIRRVHFLCIWLIDRETERDTERSVYGYIVTCIHDPTSDYISSYWCAMQHAVSGDQKYLYEQPYRKVS